MVWVLVHPRPFLQLQFFECTLVILYLIKHLEKFAGVFGGHIIPVDISFKKRRDLTLTP
jgi:hypothetical protein